ncbi:MAG: immunoglobulin domain-containing protein [Verrucomicrobiota bacterium]|nr:immunoglobulin domain-containing protein [Verrucomicrobiota bacterium]
MKSQTKVRSEFGCLMFAVLTSFFVAMADCVPPLEGTVSWWPGDGNAGDAVGADHGTRVGEITFRPGLIAEAIEITEDGQYILVPNTEDLRFTTAISIEGWIKPVDVYTDQHIVSTAGGVGPSPFGHDYYLRLVNRGLEFRINDVPLLVQNVITEPGKWYHVAATYSTASRLRRIFVNGKLAGQNSFASPINTEHTAITIGVNARNVAYGENFSSFKGLLDEITLYNRVLTAQEIADIYEAGSAGKCKAPSAPRILEQPVSKEVVLGEMKVWFAVAVYANPAASYQWRKDGTNLVDTGRITGTASRTLTIRNVQPTDVGVYTVVVSNDLGAVVSAEATLTLVQQPECVFPPTGLIAWWPFDNSLEDIAGGNNGTGNTTPVYEVGKAGKAIICDYEHHVVVPDSAAVRPASFTIEAWVKFDLKLWMTLISKGLGTGSDKSFSIAFEPDYISAGINRFYPTRCVYCEFPYEIGRWYHVAFSFDDPSDQMAVYIDGTLRGTAIKRCTKAATLC